MIKVKVERPGDSVFYVEDGVTVQYADDVLEVLDEEDSVIAVFRGWVYAIPITDEEYLTETGQAEEELEDDEEETEADFVAPETSSYVHANGHDGSYGLTDEEPDPVA